MPSRSPPRADACPDADDRLLTVRDLATLLRVSTRSVNNYLAQGALPRIKLGRATRIRMSDAMHLIQKGVA